ncbi:MAG TPA: hypothetical protein VN457_04675 [Chlamydiales bacterium]|nr:hypothetical protein [Chlamydiales bacterium]
MKTDSGALDPTKFKALSSDQRSAVGRKLSNPTAPTSAPIIISDAMKLRRQSTQSALAAAASK